MNQRQLRLGDILDDYCPRERRITNHAVVAMIEDDIKQTRCTTCDAEHEYKHAKVPAARRKKAAAQTAHLVEAGSRPPADTADIPEDISEIDASEMAEATESESESASDDQPLEIAAGREASEERSPDADAVDEDNIGNSDRDDWPVHRPLIRATLPRPEGQVPERKDPDFTFRPGGGRFDQHRNNGQRHRGHRGGRSAQGQQGQGQSSGQGQRFGGGQRGHGQGQGQGGGFGQRHSNRSGQGGGRPGQGQGQGQGRGPRPGGGRKRGR